MSGNIHKIIGKIIIAVILKIGIIFCRGISFSILGMLNKRRIGKKNELIAATLLCRLHEILVSRAFSPVIILSVKSQIRLGTSLIRVNVRTSLLQSTGTKIHSPYRQTYAYRISRRVKVLREEIIRNLGLAVIRPILSDKITAPGICRTKKLQGLILLHRIDRHLCRCLKVCCS